ncbi:MAG: LysR family transcriptional regulator [Rhizobiales bacterium]|nr:LysR family transcriptional regulator [Hyphomicrobiales bacterium]
MAAAPLDLDQLQTFVSIADTGSFTRAAEEVHRTQSAVSMQMRRLEERLGKPLFEKDGRTNRLTEEGERLLAYARRMLRLNRETLAAFDESSLVGHVRIGVPDDYAERFLPEIMARFSRSNPRVELSVICEDSGRLREHIRRGNLDIALVTHNEEAAPSEIVRHEPLLWVTSANHAVHEQTPLPVAFGRPNCIWRRAGTEVLERMGRDYRVLVSSFSATVIATAVLSGLAVSVLAECSLRPGMRVLTEADGFCALPDTRIGIMRGQTDHPALVEALARHIAESLDNITVPALQSGQAIEFPTANAIALTRGKRAMPAVVSPGW